ncbi:MAG: DUF4214 domain-containing protein [Acidimicrobiales bacterium]
MRRSIGATLAGGLLAGTLAVVLAPTAASAGVGVATSGTHVNVLVTGAATIAFSCSGGSVAVNGAVAAPALACSALTEAVVAGDSAKQTVDGRGLDAAAFSSHPFLYASLGDGSDFAYDTAQADQIAMGLGYDHIVLNPKSVADTSIDMGTGGAPTEVDTVETGALDSGNTITASTSGSDLIVTYANAAGSHLRTIANAEFAWLVGGRGDDTLTTTGITVASPVDQVRVDGGDGDDTITSGPTPAMLWGNAGSNTFTTGSGFANILTDSSTDAIHLGSGGSSVLDTLSLRSGGRTITGSGGADGWSQTLPKGDAVTHIRPAGGGGATVTNSLDRFGQQALPSSFDTIDVGLSDGTLPEPADHGLADVQALPGVHVIVAGVPSGGAAGNIADITIPTGTWSTSGSVGTSSTLTVTPNGGYGKVDAQDMSAVDVHGPWASQEQSFAHRYVRDLVFRFPTDSERNLVAAQLTAHTKTRAQLAAALMGTDEYRSLDVQRTFLDFLKRAPDPGGQAYWVDSLASGKSLRQFRAQLFGSNEYFTKAGGTNLGFLLAAYRDVFGRAPDTAGQAYWLGRLDGGTERGIVARSFLASTEARRTIVKEQFLRLLARFPTTAEADHWIPLLDGPTGEQDLIASLVASATYLAGL